MSKDDPSFKVVAELTALRRYALALARDQLLAEDLVQEALVKAYEKRSTFRPDAKLKTWLFSILHNVFVDSLRKQRVELASNARAVEATDLEAAPSQDHAVRLAQIRLAFMSLPDDQRAALHLVAIESFSYQEASDALVIPIGTLMSRLSRARTALRAIEDGELEANTGKMPLRPARLRIIGAPNDKTD